MRRVRRCACAVVRRVARSPATEIEAVVARIAGIPTRTVSTSDRDRLSVLESELKQTIFGQDQAIETLVSSIKLVAVRTGRT